MAQETVRKVNVENKKLDTSQYPFRVAQVESIDAFMKMAQKQIQVNGVRMRG